MLLQKICGNILNMKNIFRECTFLCNICLTVVLLIRDIGMKIIYKQIANYIQAKSKFLNEWNK